MTVCEADLWRKGIQFVCGVDEVGRGPLAGPVTAAAVILPPGTPRNGIRDSKLLSEKKREQLAEKIRSSAVAWAVESVDQKTIDAVTDTLRSGWITTGPKTKLAMRRAVLNLTAQIDVLLVDGNRCIPNMDIEQHVITRGDEKCLSVGAASILAKVERDRLMVKYDHIYPEYRFARNKGYPTREHRLAIHTHGPCAIHRKTFKLLPDGVVQGAFEF